MDVIEDRRVRLALVLLSTLALQKGLSSHLYVFGVAPNVLLLMTIAAGLSSTPDRGAIVGFFAGLSFDFITQGPLGLGSLSYCLVGFAAGRLQASFVRSSQALPVVAGFALTALGEGLYVVFGQVVGQVQMWTGHAWRVILVTGTVNAMLAPLAVRIFRWAWHDEPAYRSLRY